MQRLVNAASLRQLNCEWSVFNFLSVIQCNSIRMLECQWTVAESMVPA
jgi:hypothetical protein